MITKTPRWPGVLTTSKITFVAAGALTYGATSSSPPLPSGWAVGDIHIAFVAMETGGTMSTPAGWTLIASQTSASPYEYAFYRRAQSGDTAPTFTASGGGGNVFAVIAGWRNCIASGSPINVASSAWNQQATSGDVCKVTAITTQTANDMVLFALFGDGTTTTPTFSSWALGSHTPTSEFTNYRTPPPYPPGGFACAQYAQATAASTGTASVTASNEASSSMKGVLIALLTS